MTEKDLFPGDDVSFRSPKGVCFESEFEGHVDLAGEVTGIGNREFEGAFLIRGKFDGGALFVRLFAIEENGGNSEILG